MLISSLYKKVPAIDSYSGVNLRRIKKEIRFRKNARKNFNAKPRLVK